MELPSVFDASHSKAIEALLAAALNPSTQDTANVSLQACEDVPGYCSLLLVRDRATRSSGFAFPHSRPLCRISW